MISRTLKMLFLLFLFTVDVRVRASELNAIIDEPKGCWGTVAPCAIEVRSGHRFAFQLKNGAKFILLSKTLATVSEDTVRLLSGDAMVDTTASATRFALKQGHVECSKGSVSLFHAQGSHAVIDVLEGTVEAFGSRLPAGYSLDLGGINEQGLVSVSLPRSSNFTKVARSLARFSPGSLAELRSQLEKYHSAWRRAVEDGSSLYQTIATREIARVQKEEKAKRQARELREKEDFELRRLFRQRNDLE